MTRVVIATALLTTALVALASGWTSESVADMAEPRIVVRGPDGEEFSPPGAIFLSDTRPYDQDVRVSFDNRGRAVVIRTSRHVFERSESCVHDSPKVVSCTARIRASHYQLVIRTGAGDDRILIDHGILGDAEIEPGPGDDFVETRSSPIQSYAGLGADTILGSKFSDSIDGEEGADLIRSLGGEDSIDGDEGRNELFAGPGDDYLFARNGVSDVISCGPGQNEEAFVDAWPLDRGAVGCERVARHGRRNASR